MKVKLKSKRVLKRMLARNIGTYGISKDVLFELQANGLNSTAGARFDSVCEVHSVGHSMHKCTWYVPKHFIGKVVRK